MFIMNEEMIKRVISYLDGVQVYATVLRTYFKKEDLDDFDSDYLELYTHFEDFVYEQLDGPIANLTKHYQEFLVDYNDSLLYRCLDGIHRGYERRHIYNEGKREVYLRYLLEKYNYDGRDWLDEMSDEEFEDFERSVFNDLDMKKVINQMT